MLQPGSFLGASGMLGTLGTQGLDLFLQLCRVGDEPLAFGLFGTELLELLLHLVYLLFIYLFIFFNRSPLGVLSRAHGAGGQELSKI